MRKRILMTGIGGLLLVTVAARTQQPSDEIQLRQRIAAHQVASEHSDLRGLVDIYAPDAETRAGHVELRKKLPVTPCGIRRNNTIAKASMAISPMTGVQPNETS